ncbi:hypothetical protein NM208_g10368 [Fusarium decemcellulare]|uniref:Uncharacterized protein n=1 Tax=Fusarium decemcellulare TaxID=57161 RepID=A0ACC1RYN5_9HYPO|nr:hypothetical protein NM208_g10368 [Fusarium decemcellulare]
MAPEHNTDMKEYEVDPSRTDVANGILIDDDAADLQYGRTKRGLSPRHVQLITIGGSIGTGLFVGIGSALNRSGPLSLVLGYFCWGVFFVWPCNLCVAEICAYLPIRGSIFELAARYVDPALGFAMGWTYFYAGVMLVCVEYSAVATLMQYWLPDVNPAAWIAMAMAICVLLNAVAVKYYGEAEFVMASLKVILLFGLLFITFITMLGGNPRKDMHPRPFLRMVESRLVLSVYDWGPDFIALAAAEMQNPRRTIPRVAKLIFYRLVGFYVFGVLAVGTICSSQDPRLLGALENESSGAAASPWVIGIENLGIYGLPDLINFLILVSGLSCGNAFLYSSTRTLYGLARDGQAPAILMKCTKSGVPIYCVGIVSLITSVTFLVSSNSAITVFFWFVDLTTTGMIATYTMMIIVFLAWYRARKAQGLGDDALSYAAPLAPYSAYLALSLGIVAMIFVGFDVFRPFDVQGFITSYFCFPYTVGLFHFWKFYKKTKFVDPAKADLISGKKEVDEDCKQWEEGGIEENYKRRLAAFTFWRRCWERLW